MGKIVTFTNPVLFASFSRKRRTLLEQLISLERLRCLLLFARKRIGLNGIELYVDGITRGRGVLHVHACGGGVFYPSAGSS
jgi:hypothetical protein